jgi:dihydrofolate reductase
MLISLIVAMDHNRVIGNKGKLPWHISADLKNFRAITMGKPIIMGRKTHESIGRPLPGRENVVITRDKNYKVEGCTILHSLEEVYERFTDTDEIMIMGGADLYEQTLDKANRIYLTEVHAEVEGDTYFPDFDRETWEETSRQDFKADEKNGRDCSLQSSCISSIPGGQFDYSFVILKRN